MKHRLKDLSIHDRLHLEVSIVLSFCIIVVLLTLYLMFGYKSAVNLAPQSETKQEQLVHNGTENDDCACTKPQDAKPVSTTTDTKLQDAKPDNTKPEDTPKSDYTTDKGISATTEPNSTSSSSNGGIDNNESKLDPDNSVSLSFSLNETQNKYTYTFSIENTSKVTASLTLPFKDILKYNISMYNGGVIKSGTIGTVDKTVLSIKPKEIYELKLDITNVISGFNEGVYLLEVFPVITNYDKVKASVMFSVTKTKA